MTNQTTAQLISQLVESIDRQEAATSAEAAQRADAVEAVLLGALAEFTYSIHVAIDLLRADSPPKVDEFEGVDVDAITAYRVELDTIRVERSSTEWLPV